MGLVRGAVTKKIDIAAWSEPRESSNEIDIGEKQPVHSADSFSRKRSITESCSVLFSEWVPFLMASPAGVTI